MEPNHLFETFTVHAETPSSLGAFEMGESKADHYARAWIYAPQGTFW